LKKSPLISTQLCDLQMRFLEAGALGGVTLSANDAAIAIRMAKAQSEDDRLHAIARNSFASLQKALMRLRDQAAKGGSVSMCHVGCFPGGRKLNVVVPSWKFCVSKTLSALLTGRNRLSWCNDCAGNWGHRRICSKSYAKQRRVGSPWISQGLKPVARGSSGQT